MKWKDGIFCASGNQGRWLVRWLSRKYYVWLVGASWNRGSSNVDSGADGAGYLSSGGFFTSNLSSPNSVLEYIRAQKFHCLGCSGVGSRVDNNDRSFSPPVSVEGSYSYLACRICNERPTLGCSHKIRLDVPVAESVARQIS